jgi:hypothetical protein
MSTERFSDESAAALITALLASIIIGGVAVVVLSVAQSNLRATASARDLDDAIHTAETGADLVVEAMRIDREWVTPHAAPPPGADERAWAIDLARDALARVRSAGVMAPTELWSWEQGRFSYGIRPSAADGPALHAYGVSIVPGVAEQVRVVAYTFARDPFRPSHALLTRGPLTFEGNAEVRGTEANVHSNTSVTLSNRTVIEEGGRVTSAGTCTDALHRCVVAPPVDIPEIEARQFYDLHPEHAGRWLDLCDDGKVRLPTPAGPCQASSVLTGADAKGWTFDATSKVWSNTASSSSGIVYVYRANLRQASNHHFDGVTVFVEKLDDNRGADSGNLEVTGGVTWTPRLPGIAAVADRDIRARGGTGSAVIIAGEQVDYEGGTRLDSEDGAVIIAQDRGDDGQVSTPGSWVHSNHFSGGARLRYSGGIVLPIPGDLRVATWNEL